MKREEVLPLGSIIKIDQESPSLMIIGRGLIILHEEKEIYYDYAACLYPEGIINDQLIYFNQEDIEIVEQEGFRLHNEEEVCRFVESVYEHNKEKKTKYKE